MEDQFIQIYLSYLSLFMFTWKLTSSCQLPLCTLLCTLYTNIYSDIQCSLSRVDLGSDLYSGDPDVEIFTQPPFTYKPEIISITVPVFFIRSYIVGSLFGSILFVSAFLCFPQPGDWTEVPDVYRTRGAPPQSSYLHSGPGGPKPGSTKQRGSSLPRE